MGEYMFITLILQDGHNRSGHGVEGQGNDHFVAGEAAQAGKLKHGPCALTIKCVTTVFQST